MPGPDQECPLDTPHPLPRPFFLLPLAPPLSQMLETKVERAQTEREVAEMVRDASLSTCYVEGDALYARLLEGPPPYVMAAVGREVARNGAGPARCYGHILGR